MSKDRVGSQAPTLSGLDAADGLQRRRQLRRDHGDRGCRYRGAQRGHDTAITSFDIEVEAGG